MRMSTRARRAVISAAAAVAIVAATVITAPAATAAPPPPAKMASLGDSITQATMTCSALLSCPTNSWSTGSNTAVGSHFTRLRASVSPALTAVNYSATSAASSALPGQAQRAVSAGAQYVTIGIGANDACTRTVGAMTPTATFRANVTAAASALAASPSAPEIFVISIPNLTRMYELNRSSTSARIAWGLLRVCQSMLANPTSSNPADVQRRAAVQQRVNEYNQVLAEVCASTAKCRYDGGAVAAYQFSKSDISTRDYFHPSLTGQATLAAISWSRTQWVS